MQRGNICESHLGVLKVLLGLSHKLMDLTGIVIYLVSWLFHVAAISGK